MPQKEVDVESLIYSPPADSRFPNQNQTRYCYHSYVDFHRCVKARGENYEACKFFKRNYMALCPGPWIEKWDDQISSNTFPGLS